VTTYLEALTENNIIPNVVIKLLGSYYSIRQPDSGLTIDSDKVGTVSALTINPTQIDPFRPSVTASSYSFKLLDRANVITKQFSSNLSLFQNKTIEIYIGRCGVDMDFSDYLKLPDTLVSKVSKQDSGYSFSTQEYKERISNGSFNTTTKLAGSIFAATTSIVLQDASGFPNSGFCRIEDEFFSYTGKSSNTLTGCIRGEFGSADSDHEVGVDIYKVNSIQANPIDIVLQMLVSPGGGGAYDLLDEGAGIDESLIDVAQFEEIKTDFFSSRTFLIRLWNIADMKKTIEEEILFPCGLRFRANNNGKIGLALIDRSTFEIDTPSISNDQISKEPQYEVDNTKINNFVRVFWDYSDHKNDFQKVTEFTDSDSITEFNKSKVIEFKFKAIRDSLDGLDMVQAFALLFLSRFAFPRPTINLNTFLSVSSLLVGDKVDLFTDRIPTDDGDLNFGSTLEIIERAINYQTGDCRVKLSFTSFTGLRQCFIAPSDTINTFDSQSIVNIGAGRGDSYRSGWIMRLYDNTARDYADAQENEIASVVGDKITFVDPWSTTLVNGQFRIMFADYDSVVEQQKKFCFISDDGANFSDNKKTYTIGFG